MEREEVFSYVKNCINGEPASCIAACPFHLDVKSFLKKAGKGKLKAALSELNKTLPFPVMISEICPAYCEKKCQRMTVLGEETISIRLLEQTCVREKEKEERKSYVLPPLEQRCAVIGAGPVGLACALYMSKKRYPVSVFDVAEGWGGSLRKHEKFEAFEAELEKKFSDSIASFEYGKRIAGLDEVGEYDVIIVATGNGGEDYGLLDGCDRELGSTKDYRVFLAGELLGLSAVEGMAHAAMVTKAAESFLQTGDPSHAMRSWEKMGCADEVPHKGVEPSKHIVPSGEIYTKEEAEKEAGRCMQCDCEECVKSCDLLTKYKKKPPRIAIDVAQDGMTRNSVSSATITRETWSCNQCGHCADVCHADVCVGGMFELSRKDRVESGKYPPAFHGYWLEEMRRASSEAALCKGAPGKDVCKYVFFPGCRLGAADPEYVIRSYEKILEIEPETGIILDCCGIPALWAGENTEFTAHVEAMMKKWEQLGKPTLIYSCASCRKTFDRFMPDVPKVSVYELFAGAQKFSPGAASEDDNAVDYAVFDPCAAAGLSDVKAAVRTLAEKSGKTLSDYDSEGRCCGFGGHIQMADPDFYDEIANNRAGETELPFLVYCTNCMEVFKTHGKPAVHVLDAVLGLEGKNEVPTLEQKRLNNLRVKEEILSRYWNEDMEIKTESWDDISIELPEKVQELMEKLLIPESRVRQTIWMNEEACEGFENENGEVLCRMVMEYITCWVKYKKENDIYRVMEVYSHRMHIREDQI